MKHQAFTRLVCLLLALAVVIALFAGCKKTQPDSVSSKVDSGDASSVADTSSTEEPIEEELVIDDEVEEELLEPEDGVEYQELFVNNTAYTNENFLGFNFIHQLTNGYPDIYNRVYNEKQVAQELDTMQKMQVKMIRSYYGSSLAWDPVKKTHDFENEWMTAFYENCHNMKKIGVEVGITPQWDLRALVDGTTSLPTTNGWGQEIMGYIAFQQNAAGETVVDLEATAKNFAVFVKDSVLAFQSHGVTNVRQLFCFTECNNMIRGYAAVKSADTSTSRAERDYDRIYPIFDAMVCAVDQGLKDAGLRSKYQIVGPCDNWASTDESEPYSLLVKYTVEHLKGVVDVIGSHNGYARSSAYSNDFYYDLPQLKQADPMLQAKAAGMDYWIDEFNASVETYTASETAAAYKEPFKGTAVAAMASGIMNMGDVSNVYLWALYDQQWPNSTGGGEFLNGMHMVGYLPSLLNSTTPFPAWYSLSLLTRYIGQGKLFACEIGYSVYISAIERTDGELTVLVTNYNYEEANVRVNFEQSVGGKNFYRYLYDPNKIDPAPGNDMIAADAVAKKVETVFADTLPAMSVAVYTTEKP